MILRRFGMKLSIPSMISGITVLILGITPIAAYAQNNNFNQTLVETTIRAIYTEVLGRNADDNGLRGYTDSVRNNRLSLAQVRQQITNSQEADRAIRHNYQQAHGRAPDANQLRDAKYSIENGSRLDQIRR